ncbi:MAG: tail fiber domain-containing protein, partial [Candidatus Margulisiibacteriota bacterium]
GVSFHWKAAHKDKSAGMQRGFIAQDVEKVIPEWVKTDAQGFKSVEKVGVEAMLVEAIKEQQELIKKQNSNIEKQNAKIEKLEAEIKELRK